MNDITFFFIFNVEMSLRSHLCSVLVIVTLDKITVEIKYILRSLPSLLRIQNKGY